MLTLDNVTQRYIVTVNATQGVGMALFDGASDAHGRAEFDTAWDGKCRAAVVAGG